MSQPWSSGRARVAVACAIGALLIADGAALATQGPGPSTSMLARGWVTTPDRHDTTTTELTGAPTTTSASSPAPTITPTMPLPPKTIIPGLNVPVPGPGGLWPVWGPAPRQAPRPILFTRGDGPVDAISAEGTAMHQVAPFGLHPSWSADGTQIVYRGPQPTTPTAECPGTQLFVMNADGSGQHRLPATRYRYACPDESEPSWSPDGTHIAYIENNGVNNNPVGVYVMNADGSARHLVCRCDPSVGPWDDGPSWSPDGTHLLLTAFETRPALYMIGIDGSGKTRLADHARSGHWSRSGDEIVFTYGGDNSDAAGLAILDRTGGVHRLTMPRPYVASYSAPPPQTDAFPQWAPDDGSIVFSSNRDHLDDARGPRELFVIRPDGSNLRKITSQACCSTPSMDWPSW